MKLLMRIGDRREQLQKYYSVEVLTQWQRTHQEKFWLAPVLAYKLQFPSFASLD